MKRAVDFFANEEENDLIASASSSEDEEITQQYLKSKKMDVELEVDEENREKEKTSRKRKRSKDENKHKKQKPNELENIAQKDTLGEKNNLAYGLYYKDIPVYKSINNFSSLIGTDSSLVKNSTITSLKSFIENRHKGRVNKTNETKSYSEGRYFDRKVSKEENNIQRIRLALSQKRIDRQKSELIEPERNKKGMSFVPLPSVNVASSDEEGAETIESPDDYIKRRTKELNIAINASPKEVLKWLALIDFQDEVDALSSKVRRSKGLIEKKIEIFKRSLIECPNSEELLLGMLMTAKEALDENEMAKLWESTLASHSDKISLILGYAKFKSRHFTSFSVKNQRNAFQTCLNKLLHLQIKANSSENFNLNEKIEDALLSIFYSAVEFEVMMGYNERALAMYQALLEFNLEVPVSIKGKGKSTKLQYFEAYWDSEDPRIGDAQECSWAKWLEEATRMLITENESSKQEKKSNRKKAADFFTENLVKAANEETEEIQKRAFLEAFKVASDATNTISSPKDFVPPVIADNFDNSEEIINSADAVNEMGIVNNPIIIEESSNKLIKMDSNNKVEDEDETALIGIPFDVIGDADGDGYYYSVRHGRRIKNPESGTVDSLYKKMLGEIHDTQSTFKQKEKEKDAKRISADPIFAHFAALEDHSASQQWLPIRSIFDKKTSELHPERVTYFEHVEPFLFRVSNDKLECVVVKFLSFLGVNLPLFESTNSLNSREHYLNENGGGSMASFLSPSCQLDKVLNRTAYASIDETALSSASKISFIRNVFFRLRKVYPTSIPLQTALITFENQVSLHISKSCNEDLKVDHVSRARSIAKGLLQSSSASSVDLRLWDAYAALELSYNQEIAAAKVFSRALSLRAALPQDAQRHACRLYLSYSEYLLWNGDNGYKDIHGARFVLSNVVENTAFVPLESKKNEKEYGLTSIKVASIRKQYLYLLRKASDNVDNIPMLSLSNGSNTLPDVPPFCYFVACAALFEYTTIGLVGALDLFEEARNILLNALSKHTVIEIDIESGRGVKLENVIPSNVKEIVHENVGRGHSSTLPAWMTATNKIEQKKIFIAAASAPTPSPHPKNDNKDLIDLGLEWLFLVELTLIIKHQRNIENHLHPKYLKKSLNTALKLFPANPKFLAILLNSSKAGSLKEYFNFKIMVDDYLQGVNKFSAMIQVHSLPHESISAAPSPIMWLFAICAEIQHVSYLKSVSASTPSPHSIRSLFQRAISSGYGGEYIPLLWRMYIKFELSINNHEGAKRAFFLGVASCPYSKILWMDCARMLRSAMTNKEIMDALDLSSRKGIYYREDSLLLDLTND